MKNKERAQINSLKFGQLKEKYSIDSDKGVYYLIKGQIESAKDEVLGLYEVTKKHSK
jgi:hypothetical protein